MRILIASLLLVCSINIFAKGNQAVQQEVLTPLQIGKMFIDENSKGLFNIVIKEEKISTCVDEYIKKQNKSYAKMAQDNLYNLIHNFDNILSKIYGKKGIPDDMPYEEKLELLANVQCEAYYKMGVLK